MGRQSAQFPSGTQRDYPAKRREMRPFWFSGVVEIAKMQLCDSGDFVIYYEVDDRKEFSDSPMGVRLPLVAYW